VQHQHGGRDRFSAAQLCRHGLCHNISKINDLLLGYASARKPARNRASVAGSGHEGFCSRRSRRQWLAFRLDDAGADASPSAGIRIAAGG
jgi:hypothetical protein